MLLPPGLERHRFVSAGLERRVLGITRRPNQVYISGPIRPTEIPKANNKNKRKSADREVLSTLEKRAAGIKREKVSLATPSSPPAMALDRTWGCVTKKKKKKNYSFSYPYPDGS